jgi:hypothetical protein
MDGRSKKKTKQWLTAVTKANQARQGTKNKPSLTRSESLRQWWAAHSKKAAHLRKERKNRWKNEGYRKRQIAAMHSPEVLQGHSQKMEVWWKDKDNLKRMRKIRKEQAARPEEKKRKSETMKSAWQNPDFYKRMLKVRRTQGKTEQAGNNLSAGIRRKWLDPEYRQQQQKSRKYDDKWRESVAEGLKKKFPSGRVPWNKGLTKHTHPGLISASKKLVGTIPDYKKYRAWYPSNKKKKIHMRSGWEVGYALYMDDKGVKWEYEPKYFHVGAGDWTGICYIPDFYVPASHWYIEVKGREDSHWTAKFAEFKRRYPKVKLKVLRRAELIKKGVLDIHGSAVYKKAA